MGKKQSKVIKTPPTPENRHVSPITETPGYSKALSLPFVLLALYALNDFVPRFSAGDVMGSQWIYLTLVNIVSAGYLLFNKDIIFRKAGSRVAQTALTVLYGCFFLMAALSILFSINKTESLVTFSRFATTFVMYLNMALLLYSRTDLFKLIAQLLAFSLLIQAYQTLNEFYNGLGSTTLDRLIYNLKGNAGNKNILAASLVTKMAFTVYAIYISKTFFKILNALILVVGGMAIFILNARASYISLLLEVLIFIIGILVLNHKKLNFRNIALQLGPPVAALIISFFIAQAIIGNAVSMQEEDTSYGTVAERLGTISFTAEGSNARIYQWKSALAFIREHPLKGCGFGNWKLASIPYEKTFVDDFYVTYHVHNDFLETTAETGWLGGLLYISLFICAFVYLLFTLVTKINPRNSLVALITLMGLAAYFTDAVFNFPMERPVMQFFFAFIMATSTSLYLGSREDRPVTKKFPIQAKPIIAFGGLLLMIPALYICWQTYQSLVVQSSVNKDMNKPVPDTKWQDIIDAFPAIPNMNAYCFPIGHIKGFYLMQDKKYDEALAYINNSASVNPYLGLTEYLKAKIFLETKKPDSAFYYSYTGFFKKPRVKASYELLSQLALDRKDTATLKKAFYEYTKYRKEAWAWNRYLEVMLYLPNDPVSLKAIADSAVRAFPNDKDLAQKKIQLENGNKTAAFTEEQQQSFLKYFNEGMAYYTKQDFKSAIKYFKMASDLNANDYVSVENIGLSYFAQNNFKSAATYFEKVVTAKATSDGKSEYYYGISLVNLNNKTQGCYYLNVSRSKNFAGAIQALNTYCRE